MKKHSFPPLPWEKDIENDSISGEQKEPNIVPEGTEGPFTSPGDLVVRELSLLFQSKAPQVIFALLANENAIHKEEIDMNGNSPFVLISQAFVQLGRKFPNSCLSSIIVWRRMMHPLAEADPIDLFKLRAAKKKAEKEKKEETSGVDDERLGLIVDHVSLTLICNLIRNCDDLEHCDEASLETLEKAAFRYRVYLAIFPPKNEAARINRDEIAKLWIFIMSKISSSRMTTIGPLFYVLLEVHSKSPEIIESLAYGLHSARLDLSSISKSDKAKDFVHQTTSSWKNLSKLKKPELRTLCQSVGAVISTAIDQSLDRLNSSFFKEAQSLYISLGAFQKKGKKLKEIYPLAVAALCLCEPEYLNSNYDNCLDFLLAIPKNVDFRQTYLECLYCLLYALTKRTSERRFDSKAVIEKVVTGLCSSGKKSANALDSDQIEAIVDIFILLSIWDLQSTVAQLDMAVSSSTQVGSIENSIILMVATRAIASRFQPLNLALTGAISKDLKIASHYDECSGLICDTARHWSGIFRRDSVARLSWQNEVKDKPLPFTESFLQKLAKLVQVYYSSSYSTYSSSMFGSVKKEQSNNNQSYALNASACCLVLAFPQQLSAKETLKQVATLTQHSFKSVQHMAKSTLFGIISYKPAYRIAALLGVAASINATADTLVQAKKSSLMLLEELLLYWLNINNKSSNENPPSWEAQVEYSGYSFLEIEVCCLGLVSGPERELRERAWRIVHLVDKVGKQCGVSLQTASLASRLQSRSKDILERSLYWRWNLGEYPLVSGVKVHNSLKSILDSLISKANTAAGNSDEQQKTELFAFSEEEEIAWSHFLGYVSTLLISEVPPTAQFLWELSSSKLLQIQDQISSLYEQNQNSVGFSNTEKIVIFYQNYGALACCSVSAELNKPGSSKSSDILANILQYCRSSYLPLRRAVETAVSFIPSSISKTTLSCLSTYEKGLMQGKEKRSRRTQCAAICAFVCRTIAENVPEKFFSSSQGKELAETLIRQILQIVDYLSEIQPTDSVIDIQFTRFQLCCAMKFIFADKNDNKDKFLVDKKLWKFTVSCSGYGDSTSSMDDEQKKKDKQLLDQQIATEPSDQQQRLSQVFQQQATNLQLEAQNAIINIITNYCENNMEKMVFAWIGNLSVSINEKMRENARLSLKQFLNSQKSEHIFEYAIDNCYNSDLTKARFYYCTLADLYIRRLLPLLPHVSTILALHFMGDASTEIREYALGMIQTLAQIYNLNITLMPNSDIIDTYQKSQIITSQKISKQKRKWTKLIIDEGLERWKKMDNMGRIRLLRVLNQWVPNINLSKYSNDDCCIVLEKMCLLTTIYGDTEIEMMKNMWMGMGKKSQNIPIVLNYLVSLTIVFRRTSFTSLARKISLLLARSNASVAAQTLLDNLLLTSKLTNEFDYRANSAQLIKAHTESEMERVLSMEPGWHKDVLLNFAIFYKGLPWSPSNASLALLADILLENAAEIMNSLHELLLAALLALDDENNDIVNNTRFLLANLLSSTISSVKKDSDLKSVEETIKTLTDLKVPLWSRSKLKDNISRAKEDYHVIDDDMLSHYVIRIVNAFPLDSLKEKLANLALEYASVVSHFSLAIRCLQIYRTLDISLNQKNMVILLKLSAKGLEDEHSFYLYAQAMEGLKRGLKALDGSSIEETLTLSSSVSILFASISNFNPQNVAQFDLGTQLFTEYVEKVNLNDIALQNIVQQSIPSSWNPPFQGLLNSLMKGLLVPGIEIYATILISHLSLINFDWLVGNPKTKYADIVISVLPILTDNIINKKNTECTKQICSNCATRLSKAFEKINKSEIATIFTNYSNNIYSSAQDFLLQLFPLIYQSFGSESLRILSFLVELAINGSSAIKVASLHLIKSFVSSIPIENDENIRLKSFALFHSLIQTLISTPPLDAEMVEWIVRVLDALIKSPRGDLELNSPRSPRSPRAAPIPDAFEFKVLHNPSQVRTLVEEIENTRTREQNKEEWTLNNLIAVVNSWKEVVDSISQNVAEHNAKEKQQHFPTINYSSPYATYKPHVHTVLDLEGIYEADEKTTPQIGSKNSSRRSVRKSKKLKHTSATISKSNSVQERESDLDSGLSANRSSSNIQ